MRTQMLVLVALVGTEVICEAAGAEAAGAEGKAEAGLEAAGMGQGAKAGPLREVIGVVGVGVVGEAAEVILEGGEAVVVGLGIRNSEIGMVVKVGEGGLEGGEAGGEGGVGPIEGNQGAARPLIEVNIFHYNWPGCKLEFLFVH
jgi:hypothetical protein